MCSNMRVILYGKLKHNLRSTVTGNTVWHENLTVIKFHGLSKLLRERKYRILNFTELKQLSIFTT